MLWLLLLANGNEVGVEIPFCCCCVFSAAMIFWLMLKLLLKLRSSPAAIIASVWLSKERPWLSSWHNWLTVSMVAQPLSISAMPILAGEISGIGETLRLGVASAAASEPPPVAAAKNAFCRSVLDGRSLMRRDICRLNGDWLPMVLNARNEPWRSNIDGVACGRSMANGLYGLGCGGTAADGISPCAKRSVSVCWRNEPVRVNVEFFTSNVIVTPHSLSRRCLRSKQTANAQPTACESRSPSSLHARNPWHIQRRVVPSRHM